MCIHLLKCIQQSVRLILVCAGKHILHIGVGLMPVVALPRAARCTAHRYRDAWYTVKSTSLQGLALAPLGVVMLRCGNAYARLADGEHEFAYTCSIDGAAW